MHAAIKITLLHCLGEDRLGLAHQAEGIPLCGVLCLNAFPFGLIPAELLKVRHYFAVKTHGGILVILAAGFTDDQLEAIDVLGNRGGTAG